MKINPLVKKVKASGYLPKQNKAYKPHTSFNKKQNLTTVDTKKGQSRAIIARDGKPISYEPIKSPRSKTLAQIGRSINNG